MGLFENFPYANFHELNLDWILHELKELETEISNFVAINSVKYANPIIWNITSQYETNTVVLDISGNAYLSVQPVPAGVALDREEYWTKIGNFSALWDSVRSAITPYDEQHNTTASVDHKAGDWVWLENNLLLITKNITAGDKYVDGSNCKKTNVHDLFVTLEQNVTDAITAIEENRNIVSLQEFGVTGAGDESEKVQQAFAWAKAHGIGKIVSKTDVKFSGIIIDFSVDIDFCGHIAQGVRIHDQTNRIKTMFTASTSGLNISFRNMKLMGYSDLTDEGVKPDQSSPIEISNANSVVFDGCTFENINARYYSSIPTVFNQTKGVIYTILDVADTVFKSCAFNNCNGEELGLILPVAKPREYLNACFDNCIFNRPINTSAADFVGNTFISRNNVFNYDYSGSYFNALALHLIACGDTVSGNNTASVYDNCEEQYYSGYTADISNVNVTGTVKILCELAAQNCYVHDIADTSKIGVIMSLRPGVGATDSSNYIYSATQKMIKPIGIVKNVNVSENTVVVSCPEYTQENQKVFYKVYVENCVLNTGRHFTIKACESFTLSDCEVYNYVDSGFSSVPIGIFLAEPPHGDVINISNCSFNNVNKANREYVISGLENKKLTVIGCVSDCENESGNKITTDTATIGQAGNIKISQN